MTNTQDLVERQLGITGYKYGSWFMARRLIQDVWKLKPHIIQDTTFDLRDLPFMEAAKNVLWRRDLEPWMIGMWVHAYDKNSQYLSACRGANMGIGDPVHVAHGDDDTYITPGLPGIYRVEWKLPLESTFDGITFPFVFELGQEWVTNDVLIYARSKGYKVHIHEAWVFNDYKKILDKWAERVWNARKALKEMEEWEAADFVNEIAHVGVGSFATGKLKHPGIDLIHPNWWADCVGKARVNLLANIEKYGAPVCIRTDGLYYINRDPNSRTAIPGILDRMNESGGYKIPKGWESFQLTQEMFDQAQGMDDIALSHMFKVNGVK